MASLFDFETVEDLPKIDDFSETESFAIWRTLFLMVEYKKLSAQQMVDYFVRHVADETSSTNILFIDRNMSTLLRNYFYEPTENYGRVFNAIVNAIDEENV